MNTLKIWIILGGLLLFGCQKKWTTAEISFLFHGSGPETVIIDKPVHDTWFPLNRDTFMIYPNRTYKIPIEIEKYAQISLHIRQTEIPLLLQAGNEIFIEYNARLDQPFISGDNSAGQKLYGEIYRDQNLGKYRGIRDYTLPPADTSAVRMRRQFMNLAETEIRQFKILLKSEKISYSFFEQAAENLLYYQLYSMGSVIKNNRIREIHQGVPMYAGYSETWEEISKAYPPTKELQACRWFSAYTDLYLKMLQLTKDSSAAKLSPMQHTYYLCERYLPEEVQEYVLADQLYRAIEKDNRYDTTLIDLFDQFENTYPKSEYRPFFNYCIDEINAFRRTSEQNFSAGISFIGNGDLIESFEKLLNLFPENPLFVIFWFPNKAPRKSEIADKTELENFLKEKGIKILYVAIDPDKNTPWGDLIKYLDLQGCHIRTSLALFSDLYKNHDVHSYPAYMLIDSHKHIVMQAQKPLVADSAFFAQMEKTL